MRRPPRSTQSRSSAASDVYKRQVIYIYTYLHISEKLLYFPYRKSHDHFREIRFCRICFLLKLNINILFVLCYTRNNFCFQNRKNQMIKDGLCLRNRTTLSFDILHSCMVCAQTSAFWYTEFWNFRILNRACVKIQNQTASNNEARQQKNDIFVD